MQAHSLVLLTKLKYLFVSDIFLLGVLSATSRILSLLCGQNPKVLIRVAKIHIFLNLNLKHKYVDMYVQILFTKSDKLF